MICLRTSRLLKYSLSSLRRTEFVEITKSKSPFLPTRRTFRSRSNRRVEDNVEEQLTEHFPRFHELWKPVLYTAAFGTVAFTSAAVWQYEGVRQRMKQIKEAWPFPGTSTTPQRGDFRDQINLWWNGLSDGRKLVVTLIAMNAGVYALWWVPAIRGFMARYFMATPIQGLRFWPMLLSTFSHHNIVHLGVNMYVFWSFSGSVDRLYGKEQFLATYLTGGVVSSLFSYIFKVVTRSPNPTVGASGAILTALASVCCAYPEATLAIVFLPMVTFTAATALKGILIFDTAGMLLRLRIFDHAAHLGGTLFGVWYFHYGNELVWKNRKSLIEWWHSKREPKEK